MPARALSTATISFGLVSIPVKLYSAAESKAALSFNQIHKKDGARVKQQLISSRTGEVVPREEIVKGYEFAKDQYVLFEPEELKALEAQATHTIDITEFLKAEQIERRYLDKVYYLGTDKGGARAYKLLAQVLVDTGRVAIGKYAARGKQYLVMVRPMENGLVMEQLHYPDELRSFSEVPIEDATLKPAELKLATQLVQQAASDEFNPENYKDEVRERMLALIQRKVEGEDITREKPSDIARRGIIRSFQISAVFPHLTVLENVRVALQRKLGNSFHFWRSERTLDALNERAVALLQAVDLASFAGSVTVELPYGRKRALEIATTLAMDPELMLLDEPTAGMAHEDVDRVTRLIQTVAEGRTVLMVEHNMSVVSGISNIITVLQRGAVLAEGPYSEVSKNPQVMEAYMGTAA